MTGFLLLGALVTCGAAVVARFLYKNPRIGCPQFTARRYSVSRDSWTVQVTLVGGSKVKDAVCTPVGYEGHCLISPPTRMWKGDVLTLMYTPSLAEEHPDSVAVEWRSRGRRGVSEVRIVASAPSSSLV